MDADRIAVGRFSAARRPIMRCAGGASAAAAPVLFLCLFLVYPLARILATGIGPLVAGGRAALRVVLEQTDLASLLRASAGQAALSTVCTLALGLPAAYVFGRYRFPGKSVLRTLLTVPFVLPTVVVSSAFVVLIGSGGLLEKTVGLLTGNPAAEASLMRTLAAVVLAHVFYNVAVVVRIVGGAWSSLDPRLGEAARMLGASRFASLLRVTLRLLVPAIGASAVLVFSFCFSSFGVVLVLGGPRMGTLETEIYRQAVYMYNLPAAAVLSAVQLAVTSLVMYGYARLQARTSIVQNLRPDAGRAPRTATEKTLVVLFGLVPAAGLALPMGALAAGSFLTRAGVSAAYWKTALGQSGHSLFWISPFAAAGNSLLFSLEAMAISLVLGIPAAYLIARGQTVRRGLARAGASLLDILFLLPLGTSAVTLGFGFIVAFNAPPLDMRGSALLIPIAHSLVALPLVVRSLLAPLRSINPRMREAAAILGARPARVRWEVDLPMLRRAFIAAAAFAFTVSLGEFGATALLTRPELVTLPVLIYNSLSRPGELGQGQAFALSVALMAACGVGLAAIERFRAGSAEVF